MKRHLSRRLMGFMMLLVVLIMIFVGVTLFTTISISYNRDFYEEMNQLQLDIEQFNVNRGNIPELISFLPTRDSLNALRTDRTYYILRNETVIFSSVTGGQIKKTDNLIHVLNGGKNQNLFAFGDTLDFAWTLKDNRHTLYIVDHRTELFKSLKSYILLFIQALLLGIVLTTLLSYLFARQFLIPIRRLTTGAKDMRLNGDFKQIEITSKDEVGELTRVFNEMGIHITKNFQMLQDLLRNIPKPLFATNAAGVIILCNEAFKLLFDPLPDHSIFAEEHSGENRFMAEINGRYYCIYRSVFLLENGSEGTLFLLDDITEAEALENERRQFVADVSHELKTPLTVIKSYSETMLENKLSAEEQKRFLMTMEKATDQMNMMVNQLLELIKTEAAPSGPREQADLVAIIRETTNVMLLEMQKKDLACTLTLPEQRTLLCEPDKIRRVILNLLSNSIKYSNPGGRITIALRETEGGVLLSVADEGIGIEKQHLPHLFKKFYRVDKARSRETGGTGLGLSIVHSIVTGMGGTVQVKSTFGKGSEFTCFFPD